LIVDDSISGSITIQDCLIGYVSFNTYTGHSGYDCYIDAFGIYINNTGNYEASFSFENGNIESWYTYNQSGSNCYAEYLEYSLGHRDVVRLVDNELTAQYQYRIDISQTSEAVEFWFLSENQASHYFQFYSGLGQEFFIQWYSNDLKVVDKTGYHYLIPEGTYQNNEWHHYRIDFDCSTTTALFYLDFDLKYTSTTWNFNASSLTRLYVSGYTTQLPIAQLDAIGFTWLDNYTLGQNLNDSYQYNDYEIGSNYDEYLQVYSIFTSIFKYL